MYILPVLGSGADADNGMAHLVTFIHSFRILLVISTAYIHELNWGLYTTVVACTDDSLHLSCSSMHWMAACLSGVTMLFSS
jgi:hypothetical protein